MIGRKSGTSKAVEPSGPKSFDDFELRLGDVMRGERATLGKSLLDVQRELRIKANYIAAIEACDPNAFDTPGFIAGYVRSYARYLNMDPDRAFAAFCEESGFEVAHGMSAQASVIKKSNRDERVGKRPGTDMFAAPATPFVPEAEAIWSHIEPRAIGSVLVLLGLIGGIGWGGFAVLQEVQRVQVAPVDEAPVVLSDLDPLQSAAAADDIPNGPSLGAPQRAEALDRLYRPQALDVPVLTARDAPIATLDPRDYATFDAPEPPVTRSVVSDIDLAIQDALSARTVPQVVEDLGPTVRMVAAYPAWVRVRSADGATLFETTMQPGDTYDIPVTEVPPTLHVGDSGAVYFAMGSDCYGPVGGRGSVTRNLALDRTKLAEVMAPVNPADSADALNTMLANSGDLISAGAPLLATLPCQPTGN
ncbi:MAG: RodZ domain-containing protein [Pseudomonadota bacterium]